MPVMPLLEAEGNNGATEPRQIAGITLNVGCVFGMIEIVKAAVVAHCPVFGVNVYDPVAVLLTIAGFHVPIMLLMEVAGKTGAGDPLQIGAIVLNVGVVLLFTVTVNVVELAH